MKDAKQLVLKLDSESDLGSALDKVTERQNTLEKKMDLVLEKLDNLATTLLYKA